MFCEVQVLFSGFSSWEAVNAIAIMLFDLAIIKVFGWKSFCYLALSLGLAILVILQLHILFKSIILSSKDKKLFLLRTIKLAVHLTLAITMNIMTFPGFHGLLFQQSIRAAPMGFIYSCFVIKVGFWSFGNSFSTLCLGPQSKDFKTGVGKKSQALLLLFELIVLFVATSNLKR